eukprot:scaffold235492_cov15-Tisochrysis_lutea.AAC.2
MWTCPAINLQNGICCVSKHSLVSMGPEVLQQRLRASKQQAEAPLSKVPVHAEPEAAGPDPGVIIERQGPTLECFKTRLNAGSALLILRQQGPTLRCFLGLNADPDSGLELRGPKPGIAVNVAECSRQKYNADPDSGPES